MYAYVCASDSMVVIYTKGMKALNSKGILADCLTSGNVLIDKKTARISDLENTLLGGGT